ILESPPAARPAGANPSSHPRLRRRPRRGVDGACPGAARYREADPAAVGVRGGAEPAVGAGGGAGGPGRGVTILSLGPPICVPRGRGHKAETKGEINDEDGSLRI